MSDLNSTEIELFEKLFQMRNGALLNLTSSDVGVFFDLRGIQIHSKTFSEYGFLMAIQ